MPTNLYVQESFVNTTKGYRFGDSNPYETFTDNPGQLYRAMQKEYGRCTGYIYRNTDNPHEPQKIGWVFVKRTQYTDCKETYLQETWITVHTAKPTRTTAYHYATLK